MSFRFLKKKDGTKILQYQDSVKNYAWEDVPMVEEESNPIDVLTKALSRQSLFGREFSIIISESFAKKIYSQPTHQNIYSTYSYKDLSSFYGHRVYITDMKTDFKFIQELCND